MNTESEFVAHEPCNNCGSSDANSRYSDGHAYCFACHTYTPAEDWTHTHTRMNNDRANFLGQAEQLNKRRISEATNSFYRIYRYVTPYVSHITQMMGGLLDSKLKLSQRTFTTKENLQEHYLVNTYFQILANELSSLRAN